MLVLVRKLRRLSIVNTVILHLATADFLLSLTTIPQAIFAFLGNPIGIKFFCQSAGFFAHCTYCSSTYLITILAILRCYSVTRPFEYRSKVYRSKVNRICFGAWGLSTAYSLTPVFGWGKYETGDFSQCICSFNPHKHPYNWFAFLVVFYVFPMILNTVAFVWTAKVLITRKNINIAAEREANRANTSDNSEESLERAKEKVTAPDDSGCTASVSTRVTNETILQTTFNTNKVERRHESDAGNITSVRVNIELQECSTTGINSQTRHSITNVHLNPCQIRYNRQGNRIEIDFQNNRERKIEEKRENKKREPRVKLVQTDKSNMDSNKKKLRKEKLGIKRSMDKVLIIAIFCACFVLLCGPTFIVKSWYAMDPDSVQEEAFNISTILSLLNSLINPFLYGLLSKEIRSDIKKLLTSQSVNVSRKLAFWKRKKQQLGRNAIGVEDVDSPSPAKPDNLA